MFGKRILRGLNIDIKCSLQSVRAPPSQPFRHARVIAPSSKVRQRRRHQHVQPAQAQRQTVETPKAPGSESNFTGLPKDPADIPVTTPVSSQHMQVLRQHDTGACLRSSGYQKLRLWPKMSI